MAAGRRARCGAGTYLRRGRGQMLQQRPHRLGHQLKPGQLPAREQDAGGIGALPPARFDQAGLLQPGQRQVAQPVGTAVLGPTITEVTEHAVMESGILQLQPERVCVVNPTPHRLDGLPIRQVDQELQHTHRGQLRRRQRRPARRGGTSRRDPRPPTAPPAGPAPTSRWCPSGWRPEPPARSTPEPRHPDEDEPTSTPPWDPTTVMP